MPFVLRKVRKSWLSSIHTVIYNIGYVSHKSHRARKEPMTISGVYPNGQSVFHKKNRIFLSTRNLLKLIDEHHTCKAAEMDNNFVFFLHQDETLH